MIAGSDNMHRSALGSFFGCSFGCIRCSFCCCTGILCRYFCWCIDLHAIALGNRTAAVATGTNQHNYNNQCQQNQQCISPSAIADTLFLLFRVLILWLPRRLLWRSLRLNRLPLRHSWGCWSLWRTLLSRITGRNWFLLERLVLHFFTSSLYDIFFLCSLFRKKRV